MNSLRSLGGRYLAMAVGIAFVSYHLYQIVGGVIDLASISKKTPPTVATSNAQAPSSKILLGFQTDSAIWPTRVIVESVGINLPLTGSIEREGAWEISETGANYATNTAIPNGKLGNTAIFGHDRPKLFHALHDLKPGSEVKIQTKYMVYYYTVAGSKTVSPTDISVMNQTENSILTLITCDGWLSQDRLVVTANFTKSEPNNSNYLASGHKVERGLVSLTFDDGLKTSFTQALPILEKYEAKATFYVSTGLLGDSASYYMTGEEVQELFAKGHEIGSHTVSHANLTKISEADLTKELTEPRNYLNDLIGVIPKNFASPFGEYNDTVATKVKRIYESHRSSDIDLNDPLTLDRSNINIQVVKLSTTLEELKGYIDRAAKEKRWLVLVYHNITDRATEYDSSPGLFEETLKYIRSAAVDTVTVQDALDRIFH